MIRTFNSVILLLVLVVCQANAGYIKASSSQEITLGLDKLTPAIERAVLLASFTHSIDPNLIYGVISSESMFNPHANSSSSAGLMQVNLRYHRKKFKGGSVFNLTSNVLVGTSILKECLNKHGGSYMKSLSCYNGYPRSNSYANKVLTRMCRIAYLRSRH